MKVSDRGLAFIAGHEGVVPTLNSIVEDADARGNLEARFWPKVQVCGESECWPWIAKAVTAFGYGRMTAGRKCHLKAHRISWALANGPIPAGGVIRHSCDNPSCCNPRHLLLGSHADNYEDMRQRGRASPPPRLVGENHPQAKLKDADIAAILRSNLSAPALAERWGVCEKTIYRMRWRHGRADPSRLRAAFS